MLLACPATMGLPTKLSEEEEGLKKRYALLKKKREELKVKLAKIAAAESQKNIVTHKKESQVPQKAPVDAKELAKRKILSGEVKLVNEKSQQRFKRARSCSEKKDREIILEEEKSVAHGNTKTASNSFSSMDTSSDTDTNQNDSSYSRSKPHERRKGNTIFVSGYGLQESILENCFTKFGTLKNVHLEAMKGHGFVTFSTSEAAERAIAEMNGERVQGVILRVAYARRQPFENRRRHYDRDERRPPFNRTPDAPVSRDAEKHQETEDQSKENRTLVVYDDDFEF